MDFEKLYEPYKTDAAPSPAGQITWLRKEGFNPEVIDKAMLLVYRDIEQGKTFTDTKAFWEYLREAARTYQKAETDLHLKHLEEFHSNLIDGADIEWNKLTKWQKIWAVIKGQA